MTGERGSLTARAVAVVRELMAEPARQVAAGEDPAALVAASLDEIRARVAALKDLEARAQTAARGNAELDNLEEAGWLHCAHFILHGEDGPQQRPWRRCADCDGICHWDEGAWVCASCNRGWCPEDWSGTRYAPPKGG